VGKELSQMSREQRREVEEMSRKFSVEPRHARKVAGLVSELFTGLQPLHQLPPHLGKLLEAAGFLHDVGHFISDSGHHKHSYYVVANSDMPGFTAREREMIANLCRYHRKALPAAEHSHFQSLPAEEKRTLQLLVPLLRIADNLDRGHVQRVESVECRFRDGDVVLQLEAQGDVDLEQWATERVADTFRQVYQRNLVVTRARK
jgi:exopolyphosphatase/guanosine-5'-triphosphate,3'-diphosphate pyrophosphatase